MTIEKAIRILGEIKGTAGHASLTGSLRDGSGPLINAYNAVFKQAITQQWIANEGIVSEIDVEQINGEEMDYVGVSAGLLCSLLKE